MSLLARLKSEISKAIVGQERVIEEMVVCLLSGGHALLVGVPGLAKTLLVRTLARVLDLSFSRIQFTPDLMPSDITGTEILDIDPDTGRRHFRFVKGPIFANLILADEINRTPPKTQSALLEAMQEEKVTVAGQSHLLPLPFLVLATQNPIEQEGTYPLPEAQLDRFMMMITIDYPELDEEMKIAELTSGPGLGQPERVLTKAELVEHQARVRAMPLPPHTLSYAVRLARATRPQDPSASELVRKYVEWGAGPRASQFLVLGAKALAYLLGEPVPTSEHVRRLAGPVLRHRIIINFHGEAEGIKADDVIREALAAVPVEV